MISSLYKKHSITFFYLMLLLVFSHSFISAQTPDMPFNIYLKQASLKEFTAKIEQLSEYSFIYGEEVVLKHPITLDLKETPLTTILQTAFIKQDISFEITKHHIILKKTTSLPIKQHFTLNGYVLDEISKETLIGANIYDQQNKQGTITNPFGFFSITLPEGNTELNFSYIGYGSKQIALYLCKDTLLTVQLKNDNTLEEIVVLSDKMETGFQSSRMGANNIPLTHIKNTPALLSEADVLKSIQLLPGIQGGITGTSGLYVRGGSPDQNLYLLDGVPLYNVDHTLGILSIFTPESVKKVDLYKSSFPARYGGRLSSVIDVRTNDGDMRNYHGSLTIGLLTSRMHFEGPLWKDRTSFIISARRSYADLIIKPFMDKDTKGGYYLYDINTKLNHRFSDRDRLFFSFYHGKDHASFTNTSSYYFEEEKETDTKRRKWRLMFSKNGFIYPQVKKKDGDQDELGQLDDITPFGRAFLKADTYPAVQECYLRALSVEQFAMPDGNSYFSPLRWILAIMLELERRTGSSEITRIEFALWGHTTNPSYSIEKVVDNILDLRIRRKQAPSKRNFDKKEVAERGKHYDKKSDNFLDYSDMNMRYLRISGVLQRKGRGMIIVPAKHILAEKLAKSTSNEESIMIQYKRLCEGAELPTDNLDTAKALLNDLMKQMKERHILFDISDLPLNTATEINIARKSLENLLSQTDEIQYAKEQCNQWQEIADYMELLIRGGGKRTYDDDNVIEVPKDETPAYLEWILWRASLAIDHMVNKPYEVRGFKLDSDFLPVSAAGGGKGDLYCEFNDFTILTEVTMSTSSRQEAMEGEPVRRHVSDRAYFTRISCNRICRNDRKFITIG